MGGHDDVTDLRISKMSPSTSTPAFVLRIAMPFALLVVCILSATAIPVSAQEPTQVETMTMTTADPSSNKRAHRLEWKWRRVHWGEVAASAALGVTTLVINQTTEASRRWTGGILFDDRIRNGIRTTGKRKKRIRIASDVIEFSLIGSPVLINTIGVALIGDRNVDVAGQMFAIQMQAYAMSGFLTVATKTLAGRQRPDAEAAGCGGNGVECGSGANRSFFSGHAAFAFTSAGLACVEQNNIELFGRVGSKFACGLALTAASTASIFRIIGDKHWATDVLVGAGVGLWSGWLMPWVLHYRHDENTERAQWKQQLGRLAPYGNKTGLGLSYSSAF